MPSKIFSGTVIGLNSQIIEVEADVSFGLRAFNIIGLADKAIEEAKERVNSAIKSSGYKSPFGQPQRILINLAPADLKKEGSIYDLAIALGYLSSSGQIKFNSNGKLFFGELSLNGRLKPIKGSVCLALLAKEKGFNEIIIPKENISEAALALYNCTNQKIPNIIGVDSLKEAINYLERNIKIEPAKADIKEFFKNPNYSFDFSFIKGQESSKRALEITAAGSHNLLMTGPPGAGKSLMAKALPSILPSLSFEESLELTKIYSITGLLAKENPLITARPFRSPHHTSSLTSLVGGGNPVRPGEITLAHRGVLFLDEFPEFHRDVLESLRQPLEDGEISVLRLKDRMSFPAKFSLIAASNPCPCGYYKSAYRQCVCQMSQINKYKQKLSGPLMDRIDIFIEVPQMKFEKLISPDPTSQSAGVRQRIEKARDIQKQRFFKENLKIITNSEMQIPQIKKFCQIDSKSQNILRQFVDSSKLSARGYHRVLKTARTIADLAESESIKYEHLTEALMYRIREI